MSMEKKEKKTVYDRFLETLNTIAMVGVAGATIYVVLTLIPEIIAK